MGLQPHNAGAVTVKVGFGPTGPLSVLGFSRNGVDITEEPFFLNVPGDEQGGDDGPPIDVQFMGTVHRVRIQLTKWDKVVSDKLTNRIAGADTPGDFQNVVPGTFMLGELVFNRLVLDALNALFDRNYPIAILRDNTEINKGTKFAELTLVYECHENIDVPGPAVGLLYDRVVT